MSFKHGTHPTPFENVVIVKRNLLRSHYGIPLSRDKFLWAVLDLESPSLSLPVLVLQLTPTRGWPINKQGSTVSPQRTHHNGPVKSDTERDLPLRKAS